MNCCINCFADKEIIGFIFSNSTEVGQCDFCGSKDVQVVDARELEETFQPIISLYKSVADLGIVVRKPGQLHEKIQKKWGIFKTEPEISKKLLAAICSGSMPDNAPILNSSVEIEVLHNEALLFDFHEKKWESFAEEIKYRNRFFLTETIDLKLLADLLRNLSKAYEKGKIFYRARISGKEGYSPDQMGKPPYEKVTGGRANPSGIPYLYLSTKLETTIYESRSSYLDYITIGEFKLLEALNVVTLRGISLLSPFVFGENLKNYLIHEKYLNRLEQELSRPVRRFDRELDYLPSQYLCEYVKHLGYDAIEYGSSLKPGGINLAVFNDIKLQCKSAEIYEINSVELGYSKIL